MKVTSFSICCLGKRKRWKKLELAEYRWLKKQGLVTCTFYTGSCCFAKVIWWVTTLHTSVLSKVLLLFQHKNTTCRFLK